MAKQNSYLPTVSPAVGDYVTGVDVSDTTQDPSGSTKNFSVEAIAALGGNSAENLLINGGMRVAQRGTSATGLTAGSYPSLDMWFLGLLTAGTWTLSQDTDTPAGEGFANSMKLECTTADASIAGSDYAIINQRIEGQVLQPIMKGTANATSLTLSFWVKSDTTGTYTAELQDVPNNRSISQSFTVDVADTWEQKTLTFAGDASGTIGDDTTEGLRVNFWMAAGSDWTSGTLATTWGTTTAANRAVGQTNLAASTSNYISLTGVKLEVGTAATGLVHQKYQDAVRDCQRYYTKLSLSARGYVSATSQYCNTHFTLPVQMAGTPTATLITAGTTSGNLSSETALPLDDQSGRYELISNASGDLYSFGALYSFAASI